MKGQAKNLQVHKMQILKLLSISNVLEIVQLARMVAVKPDVLETILTQMQKSGKLVRSGGRVATDEKALTDISPLTISAMTVFADFIRKTDYYTAGEFPATVCFFADGAEYEIIPVESGQENIVSKAVPKSENPPNRLVLITDLSQIDRLRIHGVVAYCTVGGDGKIQYFRK